MAVSNWLLGVPDTSGDIFLANVNGVFQALATCSISSSEPPVKSAGMLWFDLNEGRLKQRNQNNSVWVPIFAIRNNQCIPLYNGAEVSNIVAVQPKGDGYLRCKNGVFILESIDSPDVPMFGVNRSGIVPGVTSAQSNQPYKLLSNGSWGEPGADTLGYVGFAGAKEYAVGVAPARQYHIKVRVGLSGTGQSTVLQIGSGGSPTQNGYNARASRWGGEDNSVYSDRCFPIHIRYNAAKQGVWSFDLSNPSGNTWVISGSGGALDVDSAADMSRGEVSLPGRLNYVRVLTAGSPFNSFNNTLSLDSGYLLVQA